MKRHPSLQALSRDHNVGLVLARRLQIPSEEVARDFLAIWDAEMADHFSEEERLLLPLCGRLDQERLAGEHQEIREAVSRLRNGELVVARDLSVLLHDHIRWEERRLFPAIEMSATPEQLDFLLEQGNHIEARRKSSTAAPRRGELNKPTPSA